MQELLPLIVAIAALASAVASVWAAGAAYRSAVHSRESAQLAERSQRRSLIRDLCISANRILSEVLEIVKLVEELKTEYRILANASGQAGSSRERLLIQRAEAKQKEISHLLQEASEVIEGRARMEQTSEEDLTELLSRFDRHVIQIVRAKEQLGREYAAAAGDNRLFRERRVKSQHGH